MAHAECRRTSAWSYTLLGITLGLLLPLVATLLELALVQRYVSIGNIIWAQSHPSMLWFMDFLPVLLGVLGHAVGRQQAEAALLNYELEKRIAQVSEANRALATEMAERAELEEVSS